MKLSEMMLLAKSSLEYLAQKEAERKEREAEARERLWKRKGWGKPAGSEDEVFNPRSPDRERQVARARHLAQH